MDRSVGALTASAITALAVVDGIVCGWHDFMNLDFKSDV